MSLEHRSYSHAVEPRGNGYWISRIVMLVVTGYCGMIVAYSVLVMGFSSKAPPGVPNQTIERSVILQTVATEALRATLSPWWKGAPWPDGVIMARLESRLPEVNPLMLHSLIGALTFSVIGFIAGRMFIINSSLLLPVLLFFATFGFLKSSLFPLVPLNPVGVAIIVAVQLACVYGFALWGKWSYRG